MALNDTLKRYKKDDRQQKEIAATWLEHWAAAGGKGLVHATVVSRLSNLFTGTADGVEFFFQHPLRASILLETLEVPEAERPAVLAEAEQFLRQGGRPHPRLIVDLSSFLHQAPPQHDGARAFFAAVQSQILNGPLQPIVLVMTTAQYETMPRTIPEKGPTHQFIWLPSEEEARARVDQLADSGEAIMSGTPRTDFFRWIAADFVRDRFVFDPTDGLTEFASNGRFEEPPRPTHDLATIHDSADPAPRLSSAVAMRRLAFSVTDEKSIEKLAKEYQKPSVRLAVARLLGVTATSTAWERLQHDLADADIEPKPTTDREVSDLLERAARRPIGPSALLVGTRVHLVNFDSILVSIAENEHVQMHSVPCAEPAITALKKHIANMTEADAIEDRVLNAAIQTLAPSPERRKDFDHARWCLMVSGAIPSFRKPALVPWRGPLTRIIASSPPAAATRVSVVPRTQYADPRALYQQRSDEQGLPFVHLALSPPTTHVLLPIAALTIPSRAPYHVVRAAGVQPPSRNDYYGSMWGRSEQTEEPSPLKATPAFKEASAYDDSERWLDLLEGQRIGDAPEHWRTTAASRTEEEGFWESSDDELAFIWLALRRALSRGASIERHDGKGILPVGGGFVAVISAFAHPPAQDVSGAFTATFNPNYPEPRLLITRVAGGAGDHVPLSIHLAGHGFGVDITFRVAPYFESARKPRIPEEEPETATMAPTTDTDDDDEYYD